MLLPEPTDVIFLKVPLVISQALLSKRYNNDATKRDIHESDLDYLDKVRKASIFVAEKYNWKVINCVDAFNKLLSVEQIHIKIKEVLNLV